MSKVEKLQGVVNTIKEKKLVEFNQENGEVKLADNLVQELLPEGLTTEIVDKSITAAETIVSAVGAVVGEQTKPYFDKNKDVEKLSWEVSVGKNYTANFTQNRVTINNNPTTGEKIEKHGAVSRTIRTTAFKAKHINEIVQKGWGGVSN